MNYEPICAPYQARDPKAHYVLVYFRGCQHSAFRCIGMAIDDTSLIEALKTTVADLVENGIPLELVTIAKKTVHGPRWG